MNKKYIIYAFFLFAPLWIMAQMQDSIPFRKNEVSLDVANIFRTGISPTFTWRHHFQNSAFRLRVTTTLLGDMSNSDLDDPGSSKSIISETSIQRSGYSFGFKAGYERIAKAGKVWFFGGLDGFYTDSFSFSLTQTHTLEYDSLGVKTKDSETKLETSTRVNQIGVSGYGGVRYFFHPRFCLSAESGLSLYYEGRRDYQDQTGNDKTTDTRNKGIRVAWLQPLVNISWFF